MKIVMYPKSNNEGYEPFEVRSLKEPDDGLYKSSYMGTDVLGESFHCSKDFWFKVETKIALPWHLAPAHSTHFDAEFLGGDYFLDKGWMRVHGHSIYRWDSKAVGWVNQYDEKPENLIPRPIDNITAFTPEEGERLDTAGLCYEEMIEAYKGVAYESQRPQEWCLAQSGRNIERLGKLMQEPETGLRELASAAHYAGFSLYSVLQPLVEGTTNERQET